MYFFTFIHKIEFIVKESSNSTVEVIPKISVQLPKKKSFILTIATFSLIATLRAYSPERHDMYLEIT